MLLFLGPIMAGARVSVKGSNATFFGLDFTQAKMVGSAGFTNPSGIVHGLFKEWNGLIATERDKFDWPKNRLPFL